MPCDVMLWCVGWDFLEYNVNTMLSKFDYDFGFRRPRLHGRWSLLNVNMSVCNVLECSYESYTDGRRVQYINV